jgi:hypothetical protein
VYHKTWIPVKICFCHFFFYNYNTSCILHTRNKKLIKSLQVGSNFSLLAICQFLVYTMVHKRLRNKVISAPGSNDILPWHELTSHSTVHFTVGMKLNSLTVSPLSPKACSQTFHLKPWRYCEVKKAILWIHCIMGYPTGIPLAATSVLWSRPWITTYSKRDGCGSRHLFLWPI